MKLPAIKKKPSPDLESFEDGYLGVIPRSAKKQAKGLALALNTIFLLLLLMIVTGIISLIVNFGDYGFLGVVLKIVTTILYLKLSWAVSSAAIDLKKAAADDAKDDLPFFDFSYHALSVLKTWLLIVLIHAVVFTMYVLR